MSDEPERGVPDPASSAGDDPTFMRSMVDWMAEHPKSELHIVRIRRKWWQWLLRRPAIRSDLTDDPGGSFPLALDAFRRSFGSESES